MNVFIDVMTIICIVIVFFVFGFNYGWRQCEKATAKANEGKDSNSDNASES